MKKRMISVLGVSGLFVLCSCTPAMAESFYPIEPTAVAGYYYTEDSGTVFLNNGTAYTVDLNTLSAGKECYDYTAYGDGDDFLIEIDDTALYLCEQPEKGVSDEGELYYALYSNYLGTTDTVECREGQNFIVNDRYVFGMNYEVAKRQALGKFLGFNATDTGGYPDRYEGPGFDTPEEAVDAYLKAFQENSIKGMLSTFAIETFADNFQFNKYIDRLKSYNISMGYVPGDSSYSYQTNLEYRREFLTRSFRYAYLTLYFPEIVNGQSMPLQDVSSEEFIVQNFRSEDFMEKIEWTGDFIDPYQDYPDLRNDVMRDNVARQAEIYGCEEIQFLLAEFKVDGVNCIQCMDTARYGDRWYNLSPGGILGSYLGLPTTSGGLAVEEVLTE